MHDASGGSWSYSPVKQWSSEDVNYSFFAYSPYADGENIFAVSESNNAGVPTLQYVVNGDSDEMVDFVAGQNIAFTKPEGSTVALSLKHQLTRLQFAAVSNIKTDDNGADQTYINISNI